MFAAHVPDAVVEQLNRESLHTAVGDPMMLLTHDAVAGNSDAEHVARPLTVVTGGNGPCHELGAGAGVGVGLGEGVGAAVRVKLSGRVPSA